MSKIKHWYWDDELHISSISIDYTQSWDSCEWGTETLTVSTDDAGGGIFFRIDTNWSTFAFDNTEEILKILKDFQTRI